MFLQFFTSLRDAQVPVTLREYLTLMEALNADLAEQTVENFYYLSRAALVKDERNLDKFDRVFGTVFKGLESLLDAMEKADIPAEWLKKLAEKYLTEEEKKQIEAMGWDKLMETLRQRLKEQQGRHQGGNKWIGTAGTSPFGAHGYNPEGVRIGQDKNREGRAVKVWDKREYKNLDDQVEVVQADLFPEGRAPLVVCNPPWLPGRPSSSIEYAIYDPDSRMLKGFLGGLAGHLLHVGMVTYGIHWSTPFSSSVLLACGMALLWGFVQYKNLANDAAGRHGTGL